MPTTYAIPDGRAVFQPLIYTGNSATSSAGTTARTITGLPFTPNLIWVKSRNNGGTWNDHSLTDSIRGANLSLSTNTTDGQTNVATAFGQGGVGVPASGGFTLVSGTAGGTTNLNSSSGTYVAWNWLGASATTSNNNGSITTQVSVNQAAGFSVIQWSGNTTSGATIGHGLGATPQFFFMHRYNTGGTGWPTYHVAMGGPTVYLRMDSSTLPVTDSTAWNNTAPSSTVITLGNSSFTNGASMVCYAWTPIAGYSAMGSYTGNGSTDGPFIYTGFKPAFILYKAISGSAFDWSVYDTSRQNYNVQGPLLAPNTSAADTTYSYLDILSNGYKIRAVGNLNESGANYVYIAFASNPFKYANAG